MALENIKLIVEQIIKSPDNDVLVIKGKWGVGKTFFWHSLINSITNANKLGKANYAYVSLFGITSLEELKNAIFAARVESSKINSSDGLSVLNANAKRLLKYAKLLPKLKEWSAITSSAAFLTIRDTLVCLDDIERKGTGIEVKNILGLASLLKDQRDCKVAIVLNDGSLADDEKEKFKRHSEKLIDIELEFTQSPHEAYACVLPKDNSYLYDSCRKLGISNIRILQRIKRFLKGINDYLTDCEPTVVSVVINSLVLFTWCYYDKDGNAPSIEHVKKYGYDPFLSTDEEELDDQSKEWNQTLRDYGYLYTDDLDLFIADYVEKGYFDHQTLSDHLSKKNAEAKAEKGREYYKDAWKLYHNTFEDNENEFIDLLLKSFNENIEYLSAMNLHSAAVVLRYFERDEEANNLIDKYISHHSSTPKRFDLSQYHSADDIKDPYLLKKFDEAATIKKEMKDLKSVLTKLIETDGWGSEDEKFLASCSDDDYYKFFKQEHGDDLHHYIQRCLKFSKFTNASEQMQAIANKAKAALEKILKESKINKLRISKIYGINVD